MASFWAAGKIKVTSAESSNPTITEAPPKMTAPAQQRKGLVLKGMSNGSTPKTASANGKTRDWADEDEDESFIAELTKQAQDPRITSLENTVAVKDERVQELEATVVTKSLRIEELESTVHKKDQRISDLKAETDEKDAEMESYKIENEKQFHQIQALYSKIDDKDVCIQELEAEVLKKDNAIRELERQSDSDSPVATDDTQISSEEGVTEHILADAMVEQDKHNTEKAPEPKKASSETSSSTSAFVMVDIPKIQELVKEKDEVLIVEKVKEEPTEARGPSMGEFPAFITKETLKVVPPAPKPKTLKFPIDMSKFVKKAAAPQPVAKRSTSPGNGNSTKHLNGHTTPWGAASKQARVKTNTMPNFAPHLDIRRMPHGERVIFANGPEVIVKMGDIKLATIPKYILMQCSDMALKYFEGRPEAIFWVLPASSMDVDAAKAHLAWMDEMTYQGRVYSITLNTAPENDRKNLEICRAARVMGLNNTYVGHFTKQLCNRIRDGAATPQFMDMVCELAFPKNDPIFECLANNLVNQKKLGQLADEAVYNKLVAKHDNLKQKIPQIEDKMVGRRSKKSPESSQRGISTSGERNGGHSGKAPAGRQPDGGAGFDTTR
jgi:hypothetical protein